VCVLYVPSLCRILTPIDHAPFLPGAVTWYRKGHTANTARLCLPDQFLMQTPSVCRPSCVLSPGMSGKSLTRLLHAVSHLPTRRCLYPALAQPGRCNRPDQRLVPCWQYYGLRTAHTFQPGTTNAGPRGSLSNSGLFDRLVRRKLGREMRRSALCAGRRGTAIITPDWPPHCLTPMA
jgi:hypothetical protein